MEQENKRHSKFKLFGGADELSGGGGRLLWDIGHIVLGFLFGGCHLVFGAYPLGIALVCALPRTVWFALVGVAIGSLTMGADGVIFALAAVLAVLIRVLVTGGGGEDGRTRTAFSESILLRSAIGLLAGALCGIYRFIPGGFSMQGLAFLLSMAALSGLLVPILSGFYEAPAAPGELIRGGYKIFASADIRSKDGFALLMFRLSAVFFIFFISLSLGKYDIFGVDFSFIFSTVVTLVVAKAYGGIYAVVVGFASSVGVSALYSTSFALLGLVSGVLFPIGSLTAIALGEVALSVFAVYAGGVTGLLSVLPEGIIGGVIAYPAMKGTALSRETAKNDSPDKQAVDMVGTMAMSYRSRLPLPDAALEAALTELRQLVSDFCSPDKYNLEESLGYISAMMRDAKAEWDLAREMDEELTGTLEEALLDSGLPCSVIRAFGKGKRRYIICAGEDKDGSVITSPLFLSTLEAGCGVRLSPPRFYRRGNMALAETEPAPGFSLKAVSHVLEGDGNEVSGDSLAAFTSDGNMSYLLISDGMGRGKAAGETSEFVARFFDVMKDSSASFGNLICFLNAIILGGSEECAATLDLFCFDRITGKASFFKAGSAASYIKRGSSLFRIKSTTMPIGVMKRVDAEIIDVDVRAGDIVVMMSDGIAGADEDAPWLINYLSGAMGDDPDSIAHGVLSLAAKNNLRRDDMSVIVAVIREHS